MRLINVKAFLDFGSEDDHGNTVLKCFNDEELRGIRYAIMSHCWCAAGSVGEMQFRELDEATFETVRDLRNRPGYQKIVESCLLTHKEGLEWLWVDTCCIMRESETELSEAVNSMYQWYRNSEICFAYLHDVKFPLPPEPNTEMFPTSSSLPQWFSCSWTLQELLGARVIRFFDQDWHLIGDKDKLAPKLADITGIPADILTNGLPHPDDPCRPSAAQIMSWAADRKATTREDRAYALMGIFEVHMPTKYGEHERAFYRLQVSIMKEYNDHSIFAWFGKSRPGIILADDPSYFRGSADVVKLDPCDAFIRECPGANEYVEDHEFFEVTKEGVEIWLPIILGHDASSQPCVQAKLACCRDKTEELITLNLLSGLPNTLYFRGFGTFYPESKDLTFEKLCLALGDNYSKKSSQSTGAVGGYRNFNALFPAPSVNFQDLLVRHRLFQTSKELPQSSSTSTVSNEVMQNVLTPVTCGMQHRFIQYEPSSHFNPQLSAPLTSASASVQGDVPFRGISSTFTPVHNALPSTSLAGANILTQEATLATSLPLSADFDSIPLPGNEVILTHTPLSPSSMQRRFIQYDPSSHSHSQPSPSHAGASALIQEDPQGTPMTSSASNGGLITLCHWVDKYGIICRQPITANLCAIHLASKHGVSKMAPHASISCCWCDPPKTMKRDSIVRHVREIHLSEKRKRGKKKGKKTR